MSRCQHIIGPGELRCIRKVYQGDAFCWQHLVCHLRIAVAEAEREAIGYLLSERFLVDHAIEPKAVSRECLSHRNRINDARKALVEARE